TARAVQIAVPGATSCRGRHRAANPTEESDHDRSRHHHRHRRARPRRGAVRRIGQRRRTRRDRCGAGAPRRRPRPAEGRRPPRADGRMSAPTVVDRAAFQAQLDDLRVREKAHTHEGDAIAAARRRLPMVEVDAGLTLVGPDGPVSLLDVFEGRRQLVAYFHMWYDGQPAAEQCEGCTFYNAQVRELAYLHDRDVTYATFCQGRYDESVRYRDFMGWDVPWYSVQDSAEALLAGRR